MGPTAENTTGDKSAGYRPLIGMIDDQTDLLAMSRAYLERDGFRAVEASDARSGLATMRRESVDLIVLDLGLPDGNGLDLLRMFRSFGDVPIIIVTGRSEETDRVLGLELGADDYLVKPFSQRELAPPGSGQSCDEHNQITHRQPAKSENYWSIPQPGRSVPQQLR
jgi:CheY-like chemotaxis protein